MFDADLGRWSETGACTMSSANYKQQWDENICFLIGSQKIIIPHLDENIHSKLQPQASNMFLWNHWNHETAEMGQHKCNIDPLIHWFLEEVLLSYFPKGGMSNFFLHGPSLVALLFTSDRPPTPLTKRKSGPEIGRRPQLHINPANHNAAKKPVDCWPGKDSADTPACCPVVVL